MIFILLGLLAIIYFIVGQALRDTYGKEGKTWIFWLPFSPILLLILIIGLLKNR